MAYVSLGINRNGDYMNPAAFTVGTDDGGAANDVTLCFNLAKALTTNDMIQICEAFIRRLEDGAYGPADVLNI